MKKIDINFGSIKIGQVSNFEEGTGLTVILKEEGMRAGCNVAGGGPASRETTLLSPLSASDEIQAVLLSGGSAFGLGAADGVQRYLAERGYGFTTPYGPVPLVVQSDIYDLGVGSSKAFPSREEAYQACLNAEADYKAHKVPQTGSVGCGTGATVGKLLGEEFMMKSGIGTAAYQIGDLKMGCIIAVNALGNVYDYKNREPLAGLLNKDKTRVISTVDTMFEMGSAVKDPFDVTNTTIGCIITNADFSKSELNKIAQMAQDGMAMAISPVHTTADGDTLYVVSEPQVKTDLNLAGTLAAVITAEAIADAVKSADSLFDIPTYSDIHKN